MQITREEAKAILLNNTDVGYGVVIEGESTAQIKEALNMAVDAIDMLNKIEKTFNAPKENTIVIKRQDNAQTQAAFKEFIENIRRCEYCR